MNWDNIYVQKLGGFFGYQVTFPTGKDLDKRGSMEFPTEAAADHLLQFKVKMLLLDVLAKYERMIRARFDHSGHNNGTKLTALSNLKNSLAIASTMKIAALCDYVSTVIVPMCEILAGGVQSKFQENDALYIKTIINLNKGLESTIAVPA
jgi:hypothetical protein